MVELCTITLSEAEKNVEDGIEETLTYYDFPSEHWTRIRIKNIIERLKREIRRRTGGGRLFPGQELCLDAGPRQSAACSGVTMEQQKVYEYEALKGVIGSLFYCRLTSPPESVKHICA